MHLSQTSLASSWSKERLADFIYSTLAFPGSFAPLENPWQSPFAPCGWWMQSLSLSRIGAVLKLLLL